MQPKLITINDNIEFLRKVSHPVALDDSDLEHDIATLTNYCLENDVLAMAANQLGILKRIIYLKNTNLDLVQRFQSDQATQEDKLHNEAKVLINPVVISKEGLSEYWENCASCLDNMGLVRRPYRIVVEYLKPNNELEITTFEGFESTVLSHELDHLDGILHIDKSLDLKPLPREERGKFRQNHDYQIIAQNGNYEELNDYYGDINFRKITIENLELACQIQNTIFPDEDGRQNFLEQINKDPYRKEQDYYVVYNGATPIGITGIYSYHEYPENAWLGWFGILDEYRHQGFGSKALDMTMHLAKEKGYQNFRLYTDEYAKAAHKLYESRGLIKELYDNPCDKDEYFNAQIFIYSKNLNNREVELWNNKTLGLKEQGEKEHLYDNNK